MKFFNQQKVDQIGVTSVSLQKILLFLMILSLFTIFNGGFLSFLICLIGFIGAYRRSSGMLTAYFSISIILIVLCSIIAISSVFMVSNDEYYSSSSSSSSEGFFTANGAHGSMARLHKALTRKVATIGSESSVSESSSVSSESSVGTGSGSTPIYVDSSNSEDVNFTSGMVFLFVVVLVLAFFLAYIKIYSLVLAFRLRKMILAAAAATALPTEAPQTHEFAPANTSCAVPENEVPAPVAPFQQPPVFTPGFAPYPYPYPPMMMMPPQMQGQQFQPFPGQQFPGQFPHHMMFGQQPVFYTYAPPAPQTAPSAEEKL
jgi:preprotein translocase subunit SecG